MVSILQPRQRALPRSLTHPAGIVFLDPAHRVSREELDRRDARWRAMRERAYARAWSEDATLVGSVRRFSARSALLTDWEERTVGRQMGRSATAQQTLHEDGASTVHSQRAPSSRGPINGANPVGGARRTRRLSNMLVSGSSRRQRKIKEAIRRLVGTVRTATA